MSEHSGDRTTCQRIRYILATALVGISQKLREGRHCVHNRKSKAFYSSAAKARRPKLMATINAGWSEQSERFRFDQTVSADPCGRPHNRPRRSPTEFRAG